MEGENIAEFNIWFMTFVTIVSLIIAATHLGLIQWHWNWPAKEHRCGFKLVRSYTPRKHRRLMGQIVLPTEAVRLQSAHLGEDTILNTFLRRRKVEIWETFGAAPSPDCKGRPLLIFVNSRSGGQQGLDLLKELRDLFEQKEIPELHKIVDLQIVKLPCPGQPARALRWWSQMWSQTKLTYRILVCGGDGTACWILNELGKLDLDYVPPVAILPLGTGNDLARVLGWGGGYGSEDLMPILHQISDAHEMYLDRWSVMYGNEVAVSNPTSQSGAPNTNRKELAMCNYFGIGVDAAIALEFHEMRKSAPQLFFSRMVNKLWYMFSGGKNMIISSCSDIAKKIVLTCDGEKVEIPPDMEGVVVLNINSFGGGTDLWGASDRRFSTSEIGEEDEDSGSEASKVCERPSIEDKKLEVVCVRGALQLGAAQIGLYRAKRIGQASSVRITTKADLPVQADGEPWRFPAKGVIEISHKGQARMLCHAPEKSRVAATDIIEWGLQKGVIQPGQFHELTDEIAKRNPSSATN